MKILVIIVTYNGEHWMEKCIGSIMKSSIKADTFVVDNTSTDRTVEVIRNINPNAIIIESKVNLGFGGANNIGMKYALDNGYDYVYLLNQDAWLAENTLENLVFVHVNHTEYGILSPMQVNAAGNHFDDNFAVGPVSSKYNRHLIEDLYFSRLQDVYEVPDVMAAHWLISRKCLEDVGGFSPTFPQYGEDNNYIDRAHYYKYKAGIVPSTRAVHDRLGRELSKEKLFYLYSYSMPLVYLSDISETPSFWKMIGFTFIALQQYRSLGLALKNWFMVLKKLPTIKRNKKYSLIKGAFLG